MITLTQLPAFDDNYVYVLDAGAAEGVVVVDAGDPGVVIRHLEATGRPLAALWCTHHHADHVGGNLALAAATGCRVFGAGHDADRIPAITDRVDVAVDDDAIIAVAGVRAAVVDVRAHTAGHIAFVTDSVVDVVVKHGHGGVAVVDADAAGRRVAFVGDALFAAGCGRLFEGDGVDLVRALARLASLPPSTLVCCAHEYTQANLRFASHARPDVPAIAARAAALDETRGASRSSVPTTIALERATNPYLLALLAHGDLDLDALTAASAVVEDVVALRRAKDAFR